MPVPSVQVERIGEAVALPDHYALYDRDGVRIDRTLTWTSQRRLGPAPDRIAVPEGLTRIDRTVVFGGLLPKPHFGHVLLEMFSRLWAHDAGHADATVPILRFTHRGRALEPFEQQLLDAALGEPRPPLIDVDRPLLLRDVLVPGQAVVLGQPMLPAVLPLYDRIRDRLVGPIGPDPRPLHLSRARLERTRRVTLGERALDDRLRRDGVRVVHPETLPLEEQIRLVASAPTVIGTSGSALHLTVFRALEGARTISLDPRTPFATQQHVDRLRGADFVHIRAKFPLLPRRRGHRGPTIGRYRDVLVPALVARRIAAIL